MPPLPPLAERPLIKTDDELLFLCAELRAAGRFALDTEFLGERTYVPRLCLVQIATTEFIALVDTLAVRRLQPLWDLIADPEIAIVLHAAREDLRLAYYGGDRLIPRNIFDTQVASGFVGLAHYPLSYARLVEALMGVRLAKGETRSEWDRRPLSPQQISYARDDVRYLLPLCDKLSAALVSMGRDSWMREEMLRFSQPPVYEPEPDLAYLRLKGSRSGLSRRPTTLVRALAAWREREAAAQDIPARTILRDEALVELALRPPHRLSDFVRLRGFPAGEETTLGPPILAALEIGRAVPEDQMPAPLAGADDETPRERAIADIVFAIGSALCLTRSLSADLVISKGDTLDLVRSRNLDTNSLVNGWRRLALGAELLQLAEGSASAMVTIASDGPHVALNSANPAE